MKVNMRSMEDIERVFKTLSTDMFQKGECVIAEITSATNVYREIKLSLNKDKSDSVNCEVFWRDGRLGNLILETFEYAHNMKDILSVIIEALSRSWDHTPEGYLIFNLARFLKSYFKPTKDISDSIEDPSTMVELTDGFSTMHIIGNSDKERLFFMDTICTKFDADDTNTIFYHKDTKKFQITVFSINYSGKSLKEFLKEAKIPESAYFII